LHYCQENISVLLFIGVT